MMETLGWRVGSVESSIAVGRSVGPLHGEKVEVRNTELLKDLL